MRLFSFSETTANRPSELPGDLSWSPPSDLRDLLAELQVEQQGNAKRCVSANRRDKYSLSSEKNKAGLRGARSEDSKIISRGGLLVTHFACRPEPLLQHQFMSIVRTMWLHSSARGKISCHTTGGGEQGPTGAKKSTRIRNVLFHKFLGQDSHSPS